MNFHIINESTFLNKNVLFIFPSSFIGGHELMSVEIIKGILFAGGAVTVGYVGKLHHIEKIFFDIDVSMIDIPFSAKRVEIFHAFFNIFLLYILTKFLSNSGHSAGPVNFFTNF